MNSKTYGESWKPANGVGPTTETDMKIHSLIVRTAFIMAFLLTVSAESMAQAIGHAEAVRPDSPNSRWTINVDFNPVPTRRIKQFYLLTVDGSRVRQIDLVNPRWDQNRIIYSGDAENPLEITVDSKTEKLKLSKPYEVRVTVENNEADKEDLYLRAEVIPNDPVMTLSKGEKAKVKSADDADIYVSGELNGAHKQKTSFATQIKLQKYRYFNPSDRSWRHTPFFKLNASTDADADPDSMEIGWDIQYLANFGAFDHKIKLESERDFGNTNLLYDTRFTFLPVARPKGNTNFKVFPNPFIGGEFGKNLHSPLKAAEGDGIARLLAGVDLRFAFYLKKDSEEPEINWTTSYVRRWLLTDELSFKADDDGKLQLRQFGTNPRDYFSSKLSYKFTKFAEVFTEYEWGQVPPSYKLVDHRFRLGFAYKYKFGVKQ